MILEAYTDTVSFLYRTLLEMPGNIFIYVDNNLVLNCLPALELYLHYVLVLVSQVVFSIISELNNKLQ